jgi:hypothetical protein
MNVLELDNEPDVDQWVRHFTAVINGEITPDERRGIFIFDRKSSKGKKVDTEQELPIKIISPAARDVDTAKSELADEKQNKHPTDDDPISHFPEKVTTEKASTKHRKRTYNNSKKNESATKAKKLKYWERY